MQHTNTQKMGDNGVIRCLPNYTYKIEGGVIVKSTYEHFLSVDNI